MKRTKSFQAENIVRLRNHLNLTQSRLAELAGLSLKGIQNIEYGVTEGSRSLPNVAKALGVTVEDLLRDPNNESEPKKLKVNDLDEKTIDYLVSKAVTAALEAQKKQEISENAQIPRENEPEVDQLIRDIISLLPKLNRNNLRYYREVISETAARNAGLIGADSPGSDSGLVSDPTRPDSGLSHRRRRVSGK